MKLIIDIGNTLIKYAVFQNNTIIYENTLNDLTNNFIIELFSNYSIKSCILSNVGQISSEILDKLNSKTQFFTLNEKTLLPFKNNYITPSTLGQDRIAGVAAASILFPNKNVLVIDAGTCITYDFINNKKEYLGGGISPGMNMRFKALNTFTAKLPLIEFNNNCLPELIGNDTKNSILSGVVNGFISEIEGIINEYKSLYNQLEIIVTGGDHKYFDKLLKYKTFAAPNLVLVGLKGILDFNEEI